MRLRNEVCRCFLAASQRFADRLVYYLLHKMQSVNDSTKLGAIDLIRHLLNSAECSMEDKRALIVMGLKPLLRDEGFIIISCCSTKTNNSIIISCCSTKTNNNKTNNNIIISCCSTKTYNSAKNNNSIIINKNFG
jgi:hypothetical protein